MSVLSTEECGKGKVLSAEQAIYPYAQVTRQKLGSDSGQEPPATASKREGEMQHVLQEVVHRLDHVSQPPMLCPGCLDLPPEKALGAEHEGLVVPCPMHRPPGPPE